MAYNSCDLEWLISEEDGANDDISLKSRDDLEGLLRDAHDSEADEQMSGLTTKEYDGICVADQHVVKMSRNALLSQQNTAEILADAFCLSVTLSYRTDKSFEMQIIKEQDSDAEEGDCPTSLNGTEDFVDFTEDMSFGDLIDEVDDKATHLAEFEQAGRREHRYLLDDVAKSNSGPLSFSEAPQHPTIPVEGIFQYSPLKTIASVSGKTKLVTAVNIHSYCISVGSYDGLIGIYDHDQSLVMILFNPDISSPVTAIDITNDRKFLVAGYESGIIALWNIFGDARSNLLLMFIDDLHTLPLKFVKILQAPKPQFSGQKKTKSDSTVTFLSSDNSGATNRIKIKKTMFAKYSYESECLLKGSSANSKSSSTSADLIISLSVLPQIPFTINAHSSARSTDWLDKEIMSFSTSTKTFIVQLKPTVKILHRWLISSSTPSMSTNGMTGIDNDSDGDSDKSISSSTNNSMTNCGRKPLIISSSSTTLPKISLDWCWSSIPVIDEQCLDATVRVPLLLRANGSSIEVLSLSPCILSPHYEGREKSNSANNVIEKGAISYSVVSHQIEGVQLVSARWLDGDCTRIAAMAETHLIMISYPDFVILDKSLLSTDVANILQPKSPYSIDNSSFGRKSAELGPDSTIVYDIGFESCEEHCYMYFLPRTLLMTDSLISTVPLPFYKVSYSNKSHIKYASNVILLVQQGKWLDALGLCVHCATKKSEKECITDSTRSAADLTAPFSEEQIFISDLIRKYADIAVCRHSVFTGESGGSTGLEGTEGRTFLKKNSQRIISSCLLGNQSSSHYQLAAQVCIQYCVELNIKNVLFGDIYEMFKMSNQESMYLRTVANYVTSYKVTAESPPALQCLPLHILYNMEKMADCDSINLLPFSSFTFSLLERCVMSLNMAIQVEEYGIGEVPRIMLKHDLISGFLYSSSYGETSSVEAFKIAFAHYDQMYGYDDDRHLPSSKNITDMGRNGASIGNCSPFRCPSPVDDMEVKTVGYKLLLFLLHNLSHLKFPSGQPSDTPAPVQHLLDLLEEVFSSSTIATLTHITSEMPTAGSYQYRYLRVLAVVDSEALLYCIAVGMRTISHFGYREVIQSLHIKLFQFISDSDRGRIYQFGERPMCEAYFCYCAQDLISAAYSLPEEMIVAFFTFLVGQIRNDQRDIVSNGGKEEQTLSARQMVCRLACTEAYTSAIQYANNDSNTSLQRYDIISDCLRSLCCWLPALLFDAGYSHARGVTYLLKSDHINLALSHLTDPSSHVDLDVFEYLKSLMRILSGETSDFTERCHIDVELKRSIYPSFQCSSGLIDATTMKEFRNILSNYIFKLAQINLSETKKVIALIYKQDIPALITATESCHTIQLELLTTLLDKVMHDNVSEDNSYFPTVSHTTFLKYVSLLLSENPEKIHSFLARCTASGYKFPLRECLLLLTPSVSHNSGGQSSYLPNADGREERAWCCLNAVALLKDLLSDLDGSLEAILLFIRCAVFDEMSDRKGYYNSGFPQNVPDNSAVIDGVQHLIQLCIKEGAKQISLPSVTLQNDSIWYTALDSLLCIPGSYGFVVNV